MQLSLSARILLRPLLFIFIVWILYVAGSATLLYWTGRSEEETVLTNLIMRIQTSLLYKNGRWDTTLYNADPYTPHPSGSGGFSSPLYIVTTEGFVIERTQPITGFLDSSEFARLSEFTEPKTISTVTNEQWRVLSKVLKTPQGETVGVATVSYYRPNPLIIAEIDAKLEANATRLLTQIRITSQEIDVSQVNMQTIDYDVAFEIVDIFNRVHKNSGRTPAFIDVSYVASVLRQPSRFSTVDARTGERYLVRMEPYYDENGKAVGVIVAGQSLKSLEKSLLNYGIFNGIMSIFLFSATAIALLRSSWYRHAREKHLKTTPSEKPLPTRISFRKKESIIQVDEQEISIPYATNQYYLCEAVFSAPKKRWELDEILDRFGEEVNRDQWRKVYDAMMLVNKKLVDVLPDKLIILQEKTYRLNPRFLPFLS